MGGCSRRESGVSVTTVIAHFKKLKPVKVNSQPIQALMAQYEVELVCEMGEQWSYVRHKKQPRWLWYGLTHPYPCIAEHTQPRAVVAPAFG